MRKIKISIITVCFNSEKTIGTTIKSVKDQTYKNVEHIIIDGGSKDGTLNLIKELGHRGPLISEKDNGIYHAMNKGILNSTGDIIGFLNSDDFYPSNDIISTIAESFSEESIDCIYGDIAFVNRIFLKKVKRFYSGRKFRPSLFLLGYMPPHPSFYARSNCYKELGLYKEDYKLSADFELLMRFIYTQRVTYKYVNKTFVHMRTGGASTKNLYSRYIINKEIIRACKENDVSTNMFILLFKYCDKIFEYIRPLFVKYT